MSESFNAKFVIPGFLLRLYPKTQSIPEFSKYQENMQKIEGKDYIFEISWKDVFPAPYLYETENTISLLFGAPILEDSIQKENVLKTLFSDNQLQNDRISSINGEFLILHFNRQTDQFTALNDRFTSIPLYYFHHSDSKTLYATPYFSDLWSALRQIDALKINEDAVFEFFWLQRVLGTKTYIQDAFFLQDASILTFSSEKTPEIARYWQRNYQKSTLSLQENAQKMAGLLRQSVRRKTSDRKRYGHFLSGGMDSRSVLGAFEENLPVCFTVTVRENRELRRAREIAKARGAEHVFLQLGENHYSDIFKPAIEIIGGMYNFDHALFLGYNDIVPEKADVCFHGHGFDYMFQGMYIPSQRVRMFGRNLYLRTMREIPEDLVSFFIENASYRTKETDILRFVSPEKREEMAEKRRQSVQEIVTRVKSLSEIRNDQWEYLTFHHLSRHYSFPNHASIATYMEQRTISFDNDIFDFYLSLPAEQRFDGKIQKTCLKILAPELAKIWSANTDLPITATCMQQTVYQIASAIKRRILREEEPDEWQERTWLSRAEVARTQPPLKEAILNVCQSDTLEQLSFLNMQTIRDEIPRWLNGENIPGIGGDFVLMLLTLGTFLKQK